MGKRCYWHGLVEELGVCSNDGWNLMQLDEARGVKGCMKSFPKGRNEYRISVSMANRIVVIFMSMIGSWNPWLIAGAVFF